MMMPKILSDVVIQDGSNDICLKIEAGDIRRANAMDPMSCAAARALKRQYKVAEVCVMRSRTYVNYGSKSDPLWCRYITPESLSREIVAIDRGGHFEPGDYTIKAPCESQKLGLVRAGKGSKRRKQRQVRAFRHVTAKIREV